MLRLAVIAHSDAQGEVKEHVTHFLSALRPLCERLVFVSNAALSDEARTRAAEHCDEVRVSRAAANEFALWKEVLQREDVSSYDELLISHSQVFGPLRPLDPIVERMSASYCDYWGMTENFESAWHLQRYFMVFKSRALRSPAFASFWDSVLSYRDEAQVVRAYEIGLSTFLAEHGLRGVAAFPTAAVFPENIFVAAMYKYKRRNPTIYYPARFLERGLPLVTRELLRDNPIGISLEPVMRHMRESGYDQRLIQFDEPPTDSPRKRDLYFLHLQAPVATLLDRLVGQRG
jgi:rhamnosyltransferase